MKRHNIELVLGFLDAVRRGDRDAAAACLDRDIVWRGVLPELVCRGPEAVLDIFMRQRGDEEIEVERLELIGTDNGAVLALHRPETWAIAGVEIRGVLYHALTIEKEKIATIDDHAERGEALAAAGG